jgi:hypothetical protein
MQHQTEPDAAQIQLNSCLQTERLAIHWRPIKQIHCDPDLPLLSPGNVIKDLPFALNRCNLPILDYPFSLQLDHFTSDHRHVLAQDQEYIHLACLLPSQLISSSRPPFIHSCHSRRLTYHPPPFLLRHYWYKKYTAEPLSTGLPVPRPRRQEKKEQRSELF